MYPVRTNLLISLVIISSLFYFTMYYERYGKSIANFDPNSTHALFYQWKHPVCNCSRYFNLKTKPIVDGQRIRSTCGPAADVRGPHQRILSFSFFGDTKSHYFEGVTKNAEVISKLYPGWIMRLYHDISPTNDTTGRERLCEVICSHSHLDDCYAPDLEDLFKGISSKHGVFWRFAAMADPLVDVTCCRDLDSIPYQREVDAVNDWLTTNKTWHVMRDHWYHKDEILAGMWGVKNAANRTEVAELGRLMLVTSIRKAYLDDQALLKKFVFFRVFNDMVAHDSFMCMRYNNTIPFPTQRVNSTFVGDKPNYRITRECPVECRPAAHKDWLQC